MRGRDLFYKYRYLIFALVHIIRKFPNPLREVLWTAVDSWRGKLGITIRYAIAKASACSCGEVVYIGPYVEIRKWTNFKIGSNVSIHRGCYIDASGNIEIGNNVSIAHGTSILSFDHQWSDSSICIRDNAVNLKSVHIMDDVWIGCGCKIMAGVTVNSRTAIAAGAVVTKSFESGLLVGGVPARPLKIIGGIN